MVTLHRYFLFGFLFFLCSIAHSAELFAGPDRSGTVKLKLQGDIKKGDAKKFAQLVVDNPNRFSLELDSPGGDLNEAIKIAKMVSSLYFTTSVKPNGVCASACFFIWLDGYNRLGSPLPEFGGRIGLHRPYLVNPEFNDTSRFRQNQAQTKIVEHLDSRFVPRRLTDIMMSRPSNDIYWLSKEDLDELGEYNSANEEFLVAKCDYDRYIFAKMASFNRAGQSAELAALRSKLDRISKCMSENVSPVKFSAKRKFVEDNKKTAESADSEASIIDERKVVERIYPDWREIVSSRNFKEWLSLQSEEIKTIYADSNKATEIIGLLDRFSRDTK
jgi:hypothetical protein